MSSDSLELVGTSWLPAESPSRQDQFKPFSGTRHRLPADATMDTVPEEATVQEEGDEITHPELYDPAVLEAAHEELKERALGISLLTHAWAERIKCYVTNTSRGRFQQECEDLGLRAVQILSGCTAGNYTNNLSELEHHVTTCLDIPFARLRKEAILHKVEGKNNAMANAISSTGTPSNAASSSSSSNNNMATIPVLILEDPTWSKDDENCGELIEELFPGKSSQPSRRTRRRLTCKRSQPDE